MHTCNAGWKENLRKDDPESTIKIHVIRRKEGNIRKIEKLGSY